MSLTLENRIPSEEDGAVWAEVWTNCDGVVKTGAVSLLLNDNMLDWSLSYSIAVFCWTCEEPEKSQISDIIQFIEVSKSVGRQVNYVLKAYPGVT